MWHEARKQEKIIRGMIVDYRRRAERRKDFYEKIKAEPTQFLQLHGRPCKIHLDPAVAVAGEGPAIMMPWQGDANNLIDRFDVRAHLDHIPDIRNPDIPPEDLSTEERQCNYESYRILAQNTFLGISEDKFLQQLAIEEQFGVTIEEKEMAKEKLNEKKGTGAAIGYNYNDPGAPPSTSHGPVKKTEEKEKDSDDDSDLDIIDVDLSIDVNKMEPSQAHELNAVGPVFGMAGCDLFSFLTGDADDAEHQKQLLREEKEKAMFSGRKSRRERRAHRDKRLATRVASPPSYAAPQEVTVQKSTSRTPSRSPSPEAPESIQFITSFGGDDEDKPSTPSKPLYADKLKKNLRRVESYSEVARKTKHRFPSEDRYSRPIGPRGPPSRSRSKSRSRSRSRNRSRSISRSRNRSRSIIRSRSRSISRSRSRSKSRSYDRRTRSRSFERHSRSRSRSRSLSRSRNYRRRSRSPANYPSGYSKRNKSRSKSRESKEPEQKPLPRYYGRRKEDKSSSELSLDSETSDDDEQNKAAGNMSNTYQKQIRSGSSSKGPSRETLSLKEKLRRKMQAQLSRQLKADKRAEAERLERESRRQARRDHEMRELAIKLRRKQREMRHQQNQRSSSEGSDKSHSRSSSRDSQPRERQRDSKSKSKSCSPEKRIPVWEINREPPGYHRTEVEVPNYPPPPLPRKRYENDTREDRRFDRPNFHRHDEEKSYNPRYDRSRDKPYNRENSDRQIEGQSREYYRDEIFNPQRRPYAPSAGYRGQGSSGRGHGDNADQGHRVHYPDPEPQWSRNESNGESSGQSRNRVKLVDY